MSDILQQHELPQIERLERELNLHQLQIKSLLTITQAINDNISAVGLFNMYKSFLSWEMGVKRMVLLIRQNDRWVIGSSIHVDYPVTGPGVMDYLCKHKRLTPIPQDISFPALREFDVLIPVYHKLQPIAFTLIGGFEEEVDVYSKVQFITTITNIVAVAIENKRLFRQQLEQERLKKAMELAEEVQRMLIPESLPSTDHYELDSIYQPHFTVGGDYFDYFQLSDKRFAFCIADISGKGVAAALLMANFQAILRSSIEEDVDLEELIHYLNKSVYRITRSDKFITFFIVFVNLENKTVQYINAGHCPPLVYRMGSIEFLTKGCIVLGAIPEITDIELGSFALESDTMILTYTDGLLELKNEKDDTFDEDHIRTFMHTYHHLSAQQYNKTLLKRLKRFKGSQSFVDDIAVLTCKIQIGQD